MSTVDVPVFAQEQMLALLHLAAEAGVLTAQQRVERAGRALALLAQRLLNDDLADRPVVVLAGSGEQGAIGLVAVRLLMEWGAWVQTVVAQKPGEEESVPSQPLETLRDLGAALAWAEEGWELPPADLLIDTLGTDWPGSPLSPVRNLIQLANSSMAPVLSLEAPAGLDLTSGLLADPHVQAAVTLVLAAPRTGQILEPGHSACGQLYLVDIGLPASLYSQLGLPAPPAVPEPVPLTVEQGKVWMQVGRSRQDRL
jgi:NAD(P)H-hydrate epimerase